MSQTITVMEPEVYKENVENFVNVKPEFNYYLKVAKAVREKKYRDKLSGKIVQ